MTKFAKIVLTILLMLLQIPALAIPLFGVMCFVPLFFGDNGDGTFAPTASGRIGAVLMLSAFSAVWALFVCGTLRALSAMWRKRPETFKETSER